jgi:pyruvate/2-oxoglutarate dehydrogenase complex dihydrolipoamide acyltransferase (E2) component
MAPRGSNPRRREEEQALSDPQQDGLAQDEDLQIADEEPDVTLDVPSLRLEELKLEVENLRTRIALQAELADMVKINVGVDMGLDVAKLEVKGLDAQTLLKAKLDNVRAILSQALETLDNNPQILEDLARIAQETAGTAERALEGPAGGIGETPDSQEADEDAEDRDTEDEDAGEPDATDAARHKAEELGVDLSQVEGTGSGGRILVKDVKAAAK